MDQDSIYDDSYNENMPLETCDEYKFMNGAIYKNNIECQVK